MKSKQLLQKLEYELYEERNSENENQLEQKKELFSLLKEEIEQRATQLLSYNRHSEQ